MQSFKKTNTIMRKGVTTTRGSIGPNASGKPFKTSGLITTGVAVAGKLALGAVYILGSVKDCTALGLNRAYDVANNVVVFEHIDEYFRMNGNTAKLYLMVAPQDTPLATLLDDPTALYSRKLIAEGGGKIYNLAVGINPEATYTETPVDGLNNEVRACIKKAQDLYIWSEQTDRPVQVLLEGRAYNGPSVSALDLRSIPASPSGFLDCSKVSLIVGQDYGFAATLTGLAQQHAAIGTALGTLSACDLNQNVGEVGVFNLTDENKGKWLVAGISSHKTVVEMEGQLDTLHEKGYLFADTYAGVSGYRWNGDATCVPIIVDADGNMNEHTIALGRLLDYCIRQIRAAYLPIVNSRQPVDPKTGLLPSGIAKGLSQIGNDLFEDMAAEGWCSGGEATVDPTSDVLVRKELIVFFAVVPYGVISAIKGTINLKIKF